MNEYKAELIKKKCLNWLSRFLFLFFVLFLFFFTIQTLACMIWLNNEVNHSNFRISWAEILFYFFILYYYAECHWET